MSERTVTFDESAAPLVLDVLGWETDGLGYLRDSDGFPVPSTDGGMIHIDRFAGVVRENGEPKALRDDFGSLVDHVKHRSLDTATGQGGPK